MYSGKPALLQGNLGETTMDQSIIVGLITGIASVPQDDLSLNSKTTIILYAQDMMKKNMENLVTKGFEPFREFAAKRKGHTVGYVCKFPDLVADARVGLMFTEDEPMEPRGDGCSVQFIRHSIFLTTKGDLFSLAEKCVVVCDLSGKPMSVGAVIDAGADILDRQNLRLYLELHPESFLKLLNNFIGVAETAFLMRKQRQENTKTVLDELNRMSRMIVGGVKFV